MTDSKKTLLPALFAVGSGLAAAPAAALELGDITVESTLGQPLRASIAYALGPNEQLASYCVSLKQGMSDSGLPAVTRADLSVANGVISLTGHTAIREPMMALRLDVSCPYTPNLSREYLLFINPAAPAAVSEAVTAADAQPAAASPVVSPAAAQATAARPTPRAVQRPQTPVASGTRYRVQPGDSLSMIASRIENRPVGLWAAVTEIFEANPGAFVDNDPNRLKAGSWLVIPDLGNGPVQFAADTEAAAPSTSATAAAEPAPAEVIEIAVPDTIVDDTAVLAPASPPAELVEATLPIAEPAPVERSTVVIPDTSLEAPALADTPNAAVATVAPRQEAPENSMGWLLWLVGGGLALIAGLLMFGRRRSAEETEEFVLPPAPAAHPMRRHTDTVETLKVPGQNDAEDPLDFDLVDDDPTAENLALDADLLIGTGLSEGTDVEIGQDFGFAQSQTVDHELPEEMSSMTPTIEEAAILESEILPEHDDYDMSVIIDARRMPTDEEDTQRNLEVLGEEQVDEIADTDSYTVDQEIDFQMLEKDYEDELTATQALNLEIEKAAAELAAKMEAGNDDDETEALPLASVTALDATSRLPADELDDTQETPAASDANTVEMATDGDDTVEMPQKKSG